jgi:hypothetical protein
VPLLAEKVIAFGKNLQQSEAKGALATTLCATKMAANALDDPCPTGNRQHTPHYTDPGSNPKLT